MAEARTAVLVNLGEGELEAQASGGGGEGGDAWGDGPGDAEGVEAAALLGDGAVKRWVAGVDTGYVLIPCFRLGDHGNDFVEDHRGGITHEGIGWGFGYHLARDEGAGVEADRAAADQGEAADGDEVWRSRASTDEVNGHATR
jgi:hypothetical protein